MDLNDCPLIKLALPVFGFVRFSRLHHEVAA